MRRVAAILAVSAGLVLTPAHARQADKEKETEPETIVFTNDDLPPPLPTTGATTARAPADVSATTPISVQLADDEHRDRNGHGEGWWRLRAAEFDIRIYHAQMEAQALHVKYVRGLTITDPTLASRSREATRRLLALEAEREHLEEEMRQAGGYPGWLRREGESLPSEPLPAPTPGEPVRSDGLTLSWSPVPRAGFYIVELQCLDCCGLMGPCEIQSLDVSGTSARFPFEADRSGRWRVRSLDAAGFGGAWSAWFDFGP